ncbi:MAG TPA: NADP-dependent oxidoreductase [Actinomycetota bacterium]
MTDDGSEFGGSMRAVQLHEAGDPASLTLERIPIPTLSGGEVLVRVIAAAITKDELGWPEDRLPATPSWEVSGVVDATAPDVTGFAVGDGVYALTTSGAAADFVVVPVGILAPKPTVLGHAGSAAVPMAGLTSWQALIDQGELEEGQRVLILGATGGVGHITTQLARSRGATVVGTASSEDADRARGFGAHEVVDRNTALEDTVAPVDLIIDTVGGDAATRSVSVLRPGGRFVSVAEEPAAEVTDRFRATYFVVEPDGAQLVELAGLVDEGELRPEIDSRFPLSEARAAFERVQATGKRGKVVLDVGDE